ncbi:MAG: hypothetical protein ACXW1D_00015 [Halobacteriota archaeon]
MAKRKSTRVGVQKDIPPPDKEELARWKPIADLCKMAVLKNEPRAALKLGKVRIAHPKKANRPEGWPSGRIVRKLPDVWVYEYNAELVLLWLWERKLTDKNPSMMYKERHKGVLAVTTLLSEYDNIEKDYLDEYH